MARRGFSTLVAQAIRKEYPGSICLKHAVVCRSSPVNFLEGFQIEPTPYKGMFYVWTFVSPLWTAMRVPKLNYGERLNNRGMVGGTVEEIVSEILNEIKARPELERRLIGDETSLDEFVDCYFQDFDPRGAQITRSIDYSIGLVLAGRFSEAGTQLSTLVKILAPLSENAILLKEVLDSIQAGGNQHDQIISDLMDRGRELLGPSVAVES